MSDSTLAKYPLTKYTPVAIETADPIEVAFVDISDANGVPELITVFPYTIVSFADKDSPSSNALNLKLLSESKYFTYIVKSVTLFPSGNATY